MRSWETIERDRQGYTVKSLSILYSVILTSRAFAERYKFSVNEQFTGHGIGRNFHQPPWILHYSTSSTRSSIKVDKKGILKKG